MSLPPLTTVYCIGFPDELLVGIDLYYFQSTPQFAGIKLIPSGTHVFHWGNGDNSSGRSGVFFTAKGENQQVVILKWDTEQERAITEHEMFEVDVSKAKSRLGDAYPMMIVYEELARQTVEKAQGTFTTVSWERITSDITANTCKRVLPPQGIVSSLSTSAKENELLKQSLHDAAKDRANKDRSVSDSEVAEDKIIQGIVDQKDQELHFTTFDIKKRLTDPVFEGRNLTMLYLDKSWYLEEIIKTFPRPQFKELLGEIELAFVVLVIFANFASASTWLSLVHLLLDCEISFSGSPQSSISFLRLFKNQLLLLPEEYQDQFWAPRDFQRLMREFHEKIYSPDGWTVSSPVVEALCKEIFDICQAKMGVTLPDVSSYAGLDLDDDEDYEDRPTIVDI